MSECILCMLIHTLHYMPCSFSKQIHRSPPMEFILSINHRTLCQIRSWKSWFLGHLRAGNSEVQGQGQRRCLLQWVLFYVSTFLSDYSHERNLGTVVGSKLINSLKEEHEERHMLSQGDRGQSKSWHCRYLSHLLTIVNTNAESVLHQVPSAGAVPFLGLSVCVSKTFLLHCLHTKGRKLNSHTNWF